MARDLKLEVLLQAVDRATEPLKKITQGSSGAAEALKASRNQLKQLERAQKDLSAFRDLKRQSEASSQALEEQQRQVRELSQRIQQAQGPTRQLNRQRDAAIRKARQLKQRYQGQQAELQQLRTRLRDAGGSTRDLAASQDRLAERIQQTNRAIGEQQDRLRRQAAQQQRMAAAQQRFQSGMDQSGNLAGAGAAGLATGIAMGMPIVAMVRNYSSFEDAMLGVARQVKGARDAHGELTRVYYEMAAAIKNLATRIPLATTEIAALVEAGARMGIEGKKNLLAFAETTAISATAFDLPVDLIGERMGKLASLYKIPIANISRLGDVINWLDDNALSKGGDIIGVMQRVAGIAATVNMSYKEAAALGSSFLSLGASQEIAGTAANAIIRELAIAKMQPKRFQEGIAALGLSAAKIQRSMSKDATGTILRVLEAIEALPEVRQLEVTTQLFGKEYGDDAAKLANNIAEYRRQLELVHDEAARGSMMKEAAARFDALSARWQILKNRLFNQSSALGKLLRSTLVELMDTAGALIDRFGAWAKENPKLVAGLLEVGAVLAAIVTALGALTLALGAVLGPFVMLRFGMTMLGSTGGVALAAIRTLAAKALPAVIAGVRALTVAIMANPIGALVALITGAVALIIYNWDTVGPYFERLWEGIKAAFMWAWEGIKTLFSWTPLGLIIEHWGSLSDWFAGLGEGIVSALGKALSWITDKFLAPVRAIKETLGAAWDALFGGDDKANAKIGRAAQTAKKAAAAAALGASVAAGPVLAGVSIDARAPISPPATGPAGGDTIEINIYAAPGMDERAIAQQVQSVLEQRERERAARRRSSLYDRE